MKQLYFFVGLFMMYTVSSIAQEQYQYDPTQLTQEQQHMLKQVKQEKAMQEKSKNLQRYRDEAKNPSKYRKQDFYNKQRQSYR